MSECVYLTGVLNGQLKGSDVALEVFGRVLQLVHLIDECFHVVVEFLHFLRDRRHAIAQIR